MYRPSSRVDYTQILKKKDCERKKEKCMFHHYITCGPPQREEVLREIKMKRFLNFYYATMKFLIFHKFCSFWSRAVYGPSLSMVDDYTAERRKTERI